jgi:hypothetical protein
LDFSMTMRSAISTGDAPSALECGSDGPDPLARVEGSVAPDTELNAAVAGADSGCALAPAAVVLSGAVTRSAGVVRILGALKKGAGFQGVETAAAMATGAPVVSASAAEVVVALGVAAGGSAGEDADASAGADTAGGGSVVVAGGFGSGWLEREPKDCALTCPAMPDSSITTSAAAMARCFIGPRL